MGWKTANGDSKIIGQTLFISLNDRKWNEGLGMRLNEALESLPSTRGGGRKGRKEKKVSGRQILLDLTHPSSQHPGN